MITSLHPRTAFLEHIARDELPSDFVRDIEHWKSRSGVVKVNLALSELPNFSADPGTNLQEHHTGSVEMAPSVEYIERAFQDAREGRPAARPFSDSVIPTTFDRTLCPEGTHIMSLFTQWVPADWSAEPHKDELEAYADRMIDCYEELAPNFRASILHRDVVGPYEMEHEYGLVGGNIFHGELSLEQLFHMRPAPGYANYRTPIKGLYYASSATHAGGGVCGIPGWQAAKAAIADRRIEQAGTRAARLLPSRPVSAREASAADDGRRDAVRSMLEARTVAVVGASERAGSFGWRMTSEVARSPGPVEMFPVNPRYDQVLGRACVPSLDDLPEPVDLVLLGVRDEALEAELGRAAARGDRSAVIFGSAHDLGAPAGPSLRERLAAIARGAEMALCGGGCMGFVNLAHGLRAIGYLEPDPLPSGPVAFVSHSGSAFSALLRTRRRLGFTLAVSSGQELVTPAASYIDYALDLPGTGIVALLLEALREPEALRSALARAAAGGIPVVALTVGGSPTGRAMVAAHSGALAGDDGAWEALFDAYGVIRVRDLDEMTDTLELFAAGRPASATSGGTGIATAHDSGAERALVVDVADALGVPFAPISETTCHRLAGIIDPGLEPGNPLDVWDTGADSRRVLTSSLVALAEDGAVAAIAACLDLVQELDGDTDNELAVIDAFNSTTKPVALLGQSAQCDQPRGGGAAAGGRRPVLEGTRTGLLAMKHLLEWRDRHDRHDRHGGAVPAQALPSGLDDVRQADWLARLAAGPIAGADAFGLLAAYGIGAVPAVAVSDRAAAVEAANRLGYPVVLKTDEPAIAHKSDVGGVVLGLAGGDEVAGAFDDLAERLGKRVLVAATAPDGVELSLGLVRDPQLGPLVVVGAGGILVELLGDRAVGLPPIDRDRRAAPDRPAGCPPAAGWGPRTARCRSRGRGRRGRRGLWSSPRS